MNAQREIVFVPPLVLEDGQQAQQYLDERTSLTLLETTVRVPDGEEIVLSHFAVLPFFDEPEKGSKQYRVWLGVTYKSCALDRMTEEVAE